MAKTFSKLERPGIGQLTGVGPGFSVRYGLRHVGFPVTPATAFGGGEDLENLPSSIDSGAMGQINLQVDLAFANYITDFQPLNINNNLNLNVEFEAGVPQPCLLDDDGNGIVTRGDIDKIFTENLGLSASEVADTLGPELASTLDLDQDGVVSMADYTAALEFIGVEGCVQQPDLSNYPKYLDLYPDDVAFAYSLRKLRDSYDGPCMTVRLDIDARCFSGTTDKSVFFQSLCNLGPDFETLPDPAGGFYRRIGDYYDGFFQQDVTLTLGGIFNQEFTNVRDAWNFFKDTFSFLNEPLEIPFTEDGYVDYALIELLMEDPLAAYGVKDTMPQAVQDQFYESYAVQNMHAFAADPFFAGLFSLTFKEKVVVLIDTWFDQRADEQRNMVGTVTKANEWGMHPFGMTSLLVGRFGKVMRRDGKFMIGSGTLTGLGDKAHLNRTGEEFGITEMLAETRDLQTNFSNTQNVFHGCATPNTDYLTHVGLGINGMKYTNDGYWAFPNGNDENLGFDYPDSTNEGTSMILSSWPTTYEVVQYYNYPSETPVEWQGGANPGWIGDPPTRFKKMQWQVGTAYLTQEQTNAEYRNPFYEADATLWEPLWLTEAALDGDPVPGYENPVTQETGNNPTVWWTGSNGKRTMFSSLYHDTTSGTQGTAAIGATGAHPGMFVAQPAGMVGYTDGGTPGFKEFRETGVNPFGYPAYPYNEENQYVNAFSGNFPEYNAFINTENGIYDPHISMFKSDQFGVVGQAGAYTNHLYRVYDDMRQPDANNNIDPGVPLTTTSSYSKNFFLNIGNYRGFDLANNPSLGGGNEEGPETFNWSASNTSRNPDAGGNMMEFVAWNDKLPLQAGTDYLEESKRYFENKKIQQ